MPDEHAPALVTRSSAPPGLLGDLADPAFLEDPYPAFRRLLAEGPVLRDDAHGMWLVAGHAEILDALKHPAASVATAAARIAPALGDQATRFAPLINAVSHFLTRLDPPDHMRSARSSPRLSPSRRWSGCTRRSPPSSRSVSVRA